MAVTAAATSKAAADEVSDDPRYGAAGTRKTARWIASAFGAIPALAALGALVRAPGDEGFDPTKLTLGIALAALGAVIGILGFARVLSPVEVKDADLDDFDMTRVLGSPYKKFSDFKDALEAFRKAIAYEERRLALAEVESKEADATAARAAADADAAATEAVHDPTPENKERANHAWQFAKA